MKIAWKVIDIKDFEYKQESIMEVDSSTVNRE